MSWWVGDVHFTRRWYVIGSPEEERRDDTPDDELMEREGGGDEWESSKTLRVERGSKSIAAIFKCIVHANTRSSRPTSSSGEEK